MTSRFRRDPSVWGDGFEVRSARSRDRSRFDFLGRGVVAHARKDLASSISFRLGAVF